MSEYLKNLFKSIIIPLILTVSSAVIGFYVVHLFQNSDVHITVLQFDHTNETYAKIYGIVQNTGTAPAKDLLLVFNYPHKYQLTGFNSTESIPKTVNSTDGILRITLDRLSPQSYIILELNSSSSKHSSSQIWVTSDGNTKSLTIPYREENFGISSLPYTVSGLSSLEVEAGIGIGLFMVIRYLLYTKSESLRRDYLGIYDIRITKFNFSRIVICCVIILISLGIAIGVVATLEKKIHPTSYVSFPISDNVAIDEFIQTQQYDNTSNQDPANAGYLLLSVGIFVAIAYSINDIKLPAFIWLLKPRSFATITLNKISLSYYTVKLVTLEYQIESDDSKVDFFAITVNDKISGLISRKELGDKPEGKMIKSFLQKDHLSIPEWDNVMMYRDNFYLAKDSITLGDLKMEMEKNIKKYALVVGIKQDLLGVVDYEAIFKDEGKLKQN